MSQLNKWMVGGKISKLVVVITNRDTGEHVERWQFDVGLRLAVGSLTMLSSSGANLQQVVQEQRAEEGGRQGERRSRVSHVSTEYADRLLTLLSEAEAPREKTEKEIQDEIQSIFRQVTASVTFLPLLDGNCTFNVLVYADADSEVPMEWGDSDAKEIVNGEKVQLRSFSTSNHRVDTLVSYRYVLIRVPRYSSGTDILDRLAD